LGTLRRHKLVHAGIKLYQCNLCKEMFYRSELLAVHKLKHTGNKPFECDICKKRFWQQDVLKRHRRTHPGESPYQCNICQKTFSRGTYLKTHRNGHLLCHYCNRVITEPNELKGYFVIVDKTTGTHYQCVNCDRQFSSFKNLVKHIGQRHNSGNLKCSVCQELDSNEPTGIGYACFLCNLEFDIPRGLKDHMLTHKTTA
jgi:KRAB domain-containing zinc finger protein